MARILFLYPALISGWGSYKENGNNESSYICHGFAMLSAVLKQAGHETICMDLRSHQNWQHFEDVLKQQTFDFTVVSFFSANERFARQAVEIVKRNFPNKYIIGGGVHLSVTQTRQYPNIDSIVLGEGEPHIIDITNTIAKGEKPQPVYDLKMVEDLNTLPYVDRNLFNPRMEETSPLLAGLPEPFITIVAGRGCWGKCTFCAPSRELISGKRIRVRSVDNFLGEIIELNKRPGGIGSLMIHDDLLGTKGWMSEFIEKWNKNLPRIPWWCQLRADTVLKMKEFIPALADTGMTYVSVGLESGSQRMLDFLQKGTTVEENIEACKLLHDNDINIFGNYIVGLPTETQEDLEATGRMLEKIRPAFHSASTYTSYPGSHLYEWIKANDYWAKPEEHYCQTRYPFEQKIKGVDYGHIWGLGSKWRELYTSPVRYYKKKAHNSSITASVESVKAITLPQTSTKAKITIILVTYNRPDMFKTAYESILNQTIKEWELIIVDNGNNPSYVEPIVKDSRVRIIKHQDNINNIAYCWNEALDQVKTKYWCSLDDDNVKYPQYLEKMVEYLDAHPENEAVVCAMEHTGNTSGVHFQKPQSWGNLKAANTIDSGQVVWCKSILEKVGYFDERLIALEDWDYMVRAYALDNKSGSAFGWLNLKLCSYHWHKDKRMYNSEINKIVQSCGQIIADKEYRNERKIRFITTGDRGRTPSQKQLGNNVLEALKFLPFVEITDNKPDIIFIMGPLYNYTDNELSDIRANNRQAQTVGLCIEDPQALHANKEYIKHLDWIVTNDINAYDYYIGQVEDAKKKRILHWNCLSISNALMGFIKDYNPEKEYDICFIGHPYPSRVEFIKQLSPLISDLKLVLIGDTWDGYGIKAQCYNTLDEIETAKIAMKSKIILLKHRTNQDLGGFPVIVPESINRGYIEAAYKSVILIDNTRKYHTFPEGIIWYNNPQDCADKIKYILSDYKPNPKLYGYAIENFTHSKRLQAIINCIKSPRYNTKGH